MSMSMSVLTCQLVNWPTARSPPTRCSLVLPGSTAQPVGLVDCPCLVNGQYWLRVPALGT